MGDVPHVDGEGRQSWVLPVVAPDTKTAAGQSWSSPVPTTSAAPGPKSGLSEEPADLTRSVDIPGKPQDASEVLATTASKIDKADEVEDDSVVSDFEAEAMQQEFMIAASQLSESELREFVLDHIKSELARVRAMPSELRPQAFRTLLIEWHPDKLLAISGVATEAFQMLQQEKAKTLSLP